jgi:putative transposase
LIEALVNARWSFDFANDQVASGQRFRGPNVGHDITHECLAAIPNTSIPGRQVTREVSALINRRAKPGRIVWDNRAT